jgi:hypothetical protein
MPAFLPMSSRPFRCKTRALRDSAAGLEDRVAGERNRFRCFRARERREALLEAARRREIDVVLVWRLDRWGRSVTDLLATLQELEHLGVGFVSLTEALDLTTPAGRGQASWRSSPNSRGRFCASEFERDWLMRGKTGSGWAGRQLQPSTLTRCENSAVLASANPRSRAG